MNLSNIEITKYIKEFFHQYMDITLNLDVENNQKVNVIIPLSKLYSTRSAYFILSKYPDTDIEKEKEVYCTDVIDGDTIWVRDVEKRNPNTGEVILKEDKYKVRLVGIDAPETSESISKFSIEFVKQCCFKKFIHLNIDEVREFDIYGRTRAVVIVYNKNLNEVLLKEKLATIMNIAPTGFNPQEWNTGVVEETNFNPTDTNDLSDLSSFINNDFNNVVFTPFDNYDIIYPYEFYKDVYYIKTNPYSKKIRMHILPRHYDCSNTVLFLKETMSDKLTINKRGNYKIYENKSPINAYFQANNQDRDRTTISNREYNKNVWDNNETYVEFSYDVSNDTKTFNDLEICLGYKYNQTSPYYAIHYTGVKDNTNSNVIDRATLLDVNVDEIGTAPNAISQMSYDSTNNKVYIEHDVENNIKEFIGVIDHVTNVSTVHHKKIKYINDSIYMEEDNIHGFCPWSDPV